MALNFRKVLPVFISIIFLLSFLIYYSPNSANDTNGTDPSTIPIGGERYRMLGDFNFDGLEDMALSINSSYVGEYILYLRDPFDNFTEYDTITSTPGGICLERVGKTIRLWRFGHISASEGSLGYCVMTDSGFGNGHGIFIHPGDGGTDMGRALLKAVWDNCDGDIRTQISHTEDSVVTWEDWEW